MGDTKSALRFWELFAVITNGTSNSWFCTACGWLRRTSLLGRRLWASWRLFDFSLFLFGLRLRFICVYFLDNDYRRNLFGLRRLWLDYWLGPCFNIERRFLLVKRWFVGGEPDCLDLISNCLNLRIECVTIQFIIDWRLKSGDPFL